ncbi:hypothetical protein H4R35_000641 [Dimargaris xerosporica]|nr:hypothetical protein H4R35_000641 [Dimargaris xerosporica]
MPTLVRTGFAGLERQCRQSIGPSSIGYWISAAQQWSWRTRPYTVVPHQPTLANTAAVHQAYFEPSPRFAQSPYSLDDLVVLPDFISTSEHDQLVRQASLKLRRYAPNDYYEGHFDSVISQYRECSVSGWVPSVMGSGARSDPPGQAASSVSPLTRWMAPEELQLKPILDRIWRLFPANTRWLPVHILDLHAKGAILAHVDNIEFSGQFVCGLCLLSPTVMKFCHTQDPDCYVKVLLPARCLYVQQHRLRYEFTHEIPANSQDSSFRGQPIERSRRITLLFRVSERLSLNRLGHSICSAVFANIHALLCME